MAKICNMTKKCKKTKALCTHEMLVLGVAVVLVAYVTMVA
jgi:hypothetical protein